MIRILKIFGTIGTTVSTLQPLALIVGLDMQSLGQNPSHAITAIIRHW